MADNVDVNVNENEAEQDFDGGDDLNAFIAKYEDDAAAEEAAPYLAENTEEPEKVDEVKPNAPDERLKTDATAEGLARLAARELEVSRREQEFDKKLAEAIKQKTPDFRGKSPAEILKLAGIDPMIAMKQMMYDSASDTNPVKAKLAEELRDYHTKSELDKMRRELETRDVEAQRAQYFQTVQTGAREYVTKGFDEKVTPIFAEVAKTEPDYMHKRVMQEIVKDASDRLAKGEDGEPLSYSDAAKRVEKDLEVLAKVLRTKVEEKPVKNSAMSNRPAKLATTITKPVVESEEDLLQKAIEQATGVYHRTENQLKGKRN